VVVLVVVLDVVVDSYDVCPPVLVPLLLKLGLDAALPAELLLGGREFGRGESVRASKTHVSARPRPRPPFMVVNATGPPKVWPDDYRKTG
jgi:hypothetical protein